MLYDCKLCSTPRTAYPYLQYELAKCVIIAFVISGNDVIAVVQTAVVLCTHDLLPELFYFVMVIMGMVDCPMINVTSNVSDPLLKST